MRSKLYLLFMVLLFYPLVSQGANISVSLSSVNTSSKVSMNHTESGQTNITVPCGTSPKTVRIVEGDSIITVECGVSSISLDFDGDGVVDIEINVSPDVIITLLGG